MSCSDTDETTYTLTHVGAWSSGSLWHSDVFSISNEHNDILLEPHPDNDAILAQDSASILHDYRPSAHEAQSYTASTLERLDRVSEKQTDW
jgi:hypothetical protein